MKHVSFYTSDCKNWHELTGTIPYSMTGPFKIIYGNKQFIYFETGIWNDNCKNVSILNSDNLSSGWKWQKNENINMPSISSEGSAYFTDVVFDDKNNRFLFPFYIEDTNTSGFNIYDGINWNRVSVNKLVKLYDCIFYQGKLFGFMDYSHWISVDDIQTYKYTDYGEMALPDPDFNHMSLGGYPKFGSYVLIDAPLWDINS